MKHKFCIAILLTVFSVVSGYCGSDRYVVILSMDAFRWDLAQAARTPTLDSIRSVGVYAETYPCFPANTFPNHYSMATGLHPDNHGIVNNTFYDKRLDKPYSISDINAVRDPDFWHGEPIWNTAERQGLSANIFMWVGSETVINGRQPSVWREYDGGIPFYDRADWLLEALHRPADSIPNLIMWYFEEPDIVEHNYSPCSAETTAMVEHIDSVLCYFMREVRSSPVFDKINFIFTSDHGMAEVSSERYVNLYPLLDNDRMKYSVASTPLYLEPDEDYVEEASRILSKVEHITVFHRDSIPDRYHYGKNKDRITSLIIQPETGWIADYQPEDDPWTGGGHGFDPFDRDMHMVFYGCGPAFKKDYQHPAFQNLNIYVLLTHLLDIEPAPNDGCFNTIKDMLTDNFR